MVAFHLVRGAAITTMTSAFRFITVGLLDLRHPLLGASLAAAISNVDLGAAGLAAQLELFEL
jgi:hypothetical protein